MSLYVDKDLNIVVRAPKNAANHEIDRFVFKSTQWIKKRREEITLKQITHPVIKGEYGEKVLYFGKKYTITETDSSRITIQYDCITVPSKKDCRSSLVLWYKNEAKLYLIQRTKELAQIYGFEYSNVKISSARTRYGSCNTGNSISYTFRLIMLPKHLIDYVIIHELCHTLYKNHKQEFWLSVEKIIPDYRQKRNSINNDYNIMDCL